MRRTFLDAGVQLHYTYEVERRVRTHVLNSQEQTIVSKPLRPCRPSTTYLRRRVSTASYGDQSTVARDTLLQRSRHVALGLVPRVVKLHAVVADRQSHVANERAKTAIAPIAWRVATITDIMTQLAFTCQTSLHIMAASVGEATRKPAMSPDGDDIGISPNAG